MSAGGILLWAGLGLLGLALLAPGLSPSEPADPKPPLVADAALPSPSARVGNGFAAHELTRSPDGHFYAEAQVNGARIRFLVDTGASIVALTPADAQRAGIALGSEREEASGAGGAVEIVPVTIDRLALGPLSATAVRGAVAEELPVSLLGQSFLTRVGTVEISGDRMVLR